MEPLIPPNSTWKWYIKESSLPMGPCSILRDVFVKVCVTHIYIYIYYIIYIYIYQNYTNIIKDHLCSVTATIMLDPFHLEEEGQCVSGSIDSDLSSWAVDVPLTPLPGPSPPTFTSSSNY